MSIWLIVALQAVQTPYGAAATVPSNLTMVPRCSDTAAPDTIVVCGSPRDRYRLPLPAERTPPADRPSGEAPGGMAALTPTGRCGLFAGERRCGKREAATYGYGGGRDPITLVGRLAGKVLDPDAD